MLSLADTTDLLDQTTTYLMGKPEPLTTQVGIDLIESWLQPLQEAENTRSLAGQLATLKALLQAKPVNGKAIQEAMGPLAEQLSLLATDMGGEGEMPSLLEALSTALRQAADNSKADTVKPSE